MLKRHIKTKGVDPYILVGDLAGALVDTEIIASSGSLFVGCRLVVGRADSGVAVLLLLGDFASSTRIESVGIEFALGVIDNSAVLAAVLTDALLGRTLGSIGMHLAGVRRSAILDLLGLAVSSALVDSLGKLAGWVKVLGALGVSSGTLAEILADCWLIGGRLVADLVFFAILLDFRRDTFAGAREDRLRRSIGGERLLAGARKTLEADGLIVGTVALFQWWSSTAGVQTGLGYAGFGIAALRIRRLSTNSSTLVKRLLLIATALRECVAANLIIVTNK